MLANLININLFCRSEKFPYLLPERRKLDLVFNTKTEFSEAMKCVEGSNSGSGHAR